MNRTLQEILKNTSKTNKTSKATDLAGLQGKIKEAIIRAELESTDYIFIKCAEANTLGLPCPYSQEFLEEIGAKRQALRDKLPS